MNNIIRFWNQNRKKIIIGIIAIVFLILLTQTLNEVAKQQKENRANQVKENKTIPNLPTQSIITGEKIDVSTTENNMEIIEKFVKYCNAGKIEEAYELLTQDCKEEQFPTLEDFKNNYYKLIFTEKKLYEAKNYRNFSGSYTYEVKFYNDVLSQGKVSTTEIYTDYITIITKEKNKY